MIVTQQYRDCELDELIFQNMKQLTWTNFEMVNVLTEVAYDCVAIFQWYLYIFYFLSYEYTIRANKFC